jgi:hypothetical protein
MSVTQAQALSVGIIVGICLWMHPLFRARAAVLSILMVHFIVLFVLRPEKAGWAGLTFILVIPFDDGVVSWFTLPSSLLPWLILLPLPMPWRRILPIMPFHC